jgi:hypothetical protein
MTEPTTDGEQAAGEPWAVIDPYEGPPQRFATEAEAVKHAQRLIEESMDDGTWDENVQDIAVVYVHHEVIEKVLHTRTPEMTADEWYELTGDEDDHDRWIDYVLVPVSAASGGASDG